MRRSEFIQQFVKDAPWTPDVEESLYASGRVEWAIHQADALEAAGIVFDPEPSNGELYCGVCGCLRPYHSSACVWFGKETP